MTKYIIVFLLILCGVFSALSYHFYGAKAEAESALVQVIDANTSLQKSLNLQVKSCEISDKVVSEYQGEKQSQQDKTQAAVTSIQNIPKKVVGATKVVMNEEIDVDSKLPSSLQLLLNQNCLQGEGDACISPR